MATKKKSSRKAAIDRKVAARKAAIARKVAARKKTTARNVSARKKGLKPIRVTSRKRGQDVDISQKFAGSFLGAIKRNTGYYLTYGHEGVKVRKTTPVARMTSDERRRAYDRADATGAGGGTRDPVTYKSKAPWVVRSEKAGRKKKRTKRVSKRKSR